MGFCPFVLHTGGCGVRLFLPCSVGPERSNGVTKTALHFLFVFLRHHGAGWQRLFMKTAICIWGTAQIGKTSVIKEVFRKVTHHHQPLIYRYREYGPDIFAIVDLASGRIGIASMGDPESAQQECLDDLVQSSCDIIVCASRTKGSTVRALYQLKEENGYNLIWTSPFSSKDVDPEKLNDVFSDSVIELIKRIGI